MNVIFLPKVEKCVIVFHNIINSLLTVREKAFIDFQFLIFNFQFENAFEQSEKGFLIITNA